MAWQRNHYCFNRTTPCREKHVPAIVGAGETDVRKGRQQPGGQGFPRDNRRDPPDPHVDGERHACDQTAYPGDGKAVPWNPLHQDSRRAPENGTEEHLKNGCISLFHKFSAWILVTSVMRGNALLPPFKPKHMFTTEWMCAILLLEK